jgi:hypothetical protein
MKRHLTGLKKELDKGGHVQKVDVEIIFLPVSIRGSYTKVGED